MLYLKIGAREAFFTYVDLNQTRVFQNQAHRDSYQRTFEEVMNEGVADDEVRALPAHWSRPIKKSELLYNLSSMCSVLFTKAHSCLLRLQDNLKQSKMPRSVGIIQKQPLVLNLQDPALLTRLKETVKLVVAIAQELLRFRDTAEAQGRTDHSVKTHLQSTMQNIWFSLMSLERVFSLHVLASHLDPSCQVDE